MKPGQHSPVATLHSAGPHRNVPGVDKLPESALASTGASESAIASRLPPSSGPASKGALPSPPSLADEVGASGLDEHARMPTTTRATLMCRGIRIGVLLTRSPHV